MRNLHRSLFLTILIFGLVFSLHAQVKKEENSLLWEISGKDLQKPSFLFGTYHFAGKDFIDTMRIVNQKMEQADAIVGELVMDKNMAMALVPFMLMKDESLGQLLKTDEFELVANHLKKTLGYDLLTLNKLKPVAIQTLILQFDAPKTISATNPPLDQYIQDYGRERQKKIIGLETLEDQAKVLFGNSLERQKTMLLKSIKETDKNKIEIQQMYALYIAQNLTELEKLFNTNNDYTQEEMDQLLKHRNEKWLAQLPTLLQSQSLFIAVGAGHLMGTDGLLNGLKKMGYTVKPIATN